MPTCKKNKATIFTIIIIIIADIYISNYVKSIYKCLIQLTLFITTNSYNK